MKLKIKIKIYKKREKINRALIFFSIDLELTIIQIEIFIFTMIFIDNLTIIRFSTFSIKLISRDYYIFQFHYFH